MSFDKDDGKRPSLGVVVSLLDLGNGQSRLIMDGVRSQHSVRETEKRHGASMSSTHINYMGIRLSMKWHFRMMPIAISESL